MQGAGLSHWMCLEVGRRLKVTFYNTENKLQLSFRGKVSFLQDYGALTNDVCFHSGYHVHWDSGLLEEDCKRWRTQGFLQRCLVQRIERHGRCFCIGIVWWDQKVCLMWLKLEFIGSRSIVWFNRLFLRGSKKERSGMKPDWKEYLRGGGKSLSIH